MYVCAYISSVLVESRDKDIHDLNKIYLVLPFYHVCLNMHGNSPFIQHYIMTNHIFAVLCPQIECC